MSGPGHSLLATTLGPLDVLGAIEGGRDFDALMPIVELKRLSTHPKDKRVLPELEATLARLRGS